jgi:hypothetical protein
VTRNYLHHTRTGYASQSYGIEFLLQGTANLVENNIFYHLHSAMMIAGGLTGTVFAYNYATEVRNVQPNTLGIDGGIHGGFPSMILLEGNVFHKLVCDSYWGTNGYITLLRNHIRGHAPGTTTANIAVDIQAGNRYVNAIGNVLGTPAFNGSYECVDVQAPYWNTWAIYKLGYNSFGDGDPADNDPLVPATLIRHGNFDYVSDSVRWDPGIPDREIPASLYLPSKPGFFGDLDWPPVRPDSGSGQMLGHLPAGVRFDSVIASDTVSPLTPPDFEVIRVSGRTATLYWRFTEDDLAMDEYEIYRDGVRVHGTIYEGPWQDRSLENLTGYTYTIRARDYAGNDDNESDPFRVTTLDSQHYPLRVTGGSGSGTYDEGAAVPVEADNRESEGYAFSQWIGDMAYASSAWSPSATVEVWDSTGLGACFRKSDGQDTEPPQAPPRFRAIMVSRNFVQLGWDIPADDAGVHHFSLSFGNGTAIDSWIQELDFIHAGLLPGTAYDYMLTASDLAGNTSQPVYLSVTTLPDSVSPDTTLPDTTLVIPPAIAGEPPVIFPNPTNGRVKVSRVPVRSVYVFDMQGTRLRESRGPVVDLGGLPGGTYIVEVTSRDNRRYQRRVVVF